MVAGARMSDCLTDVSVLAFAESTSTAAKLLFPAAALGNALAALLLLRAFGQLIAEDLPARVQ